MQLNLSSFYSLYSNLSNPLNYFSSHVVLLLKLAPTTYLCPQLWELARSDLALILWKSGTGTPSVLCTRGSAYISLPKFISHHWIRVFKWVSHETKSSQKSGMLSLFRGIFLTPGPVPITQKWKMSINGIEHYYNVLIPRYSLFSINRLIIFTLKLHVVINTYM